MSLATYHVNQNANRHKLSVLRKMGRPTALPSHTKPNQLSAENTFTYNTGNYETRCSISTLLTHLMPYRRVRDLKQTMSAKATCLEKQMSIYFDKSISKVTKHLDSQSTFVGTWNKGTKFESTLNTREGPMTSATIYEYPTNLISAKTTYLEPMFKELKYLDSQSTITGTWSADNSFRLTLSPRQISLVSTRTSKIIEESRNKRLARYREQERVFGGSIYPCLGSSGDGELDRPVMSAPRSATTEMRESKKIESRSFFENIKNTNHSCGIGEPLQELFRQYKIRHFRRSCSQNSKQFSSTTELQRYISVRKQWRSMERHADWENKRANSIISKRQNCSADSIDRLRRENHKHLEDKRNPNRTLSEHSDCLTLSTERLPRQYYEPTKLSDCPMLGENNQSAELPDCPDANIIERNRTVPSQESLKTQSQQSLTQSEKTDEKRVTINECLNTTMYYDKSSSTSTRSSSQNEYKVEKNFKRHFAESSETNDSADNQTYDLDAKEIPCIYMVEKNRCKSKVEKNRCMSKLKNNRCMHKLQKDLHKSGLREKTSCMCELEHKSPYDYWLVEQMNLCSSKIEENPSRIKLLKVPSPYNEHSYKTKSVRQKSNSTQSVFLKNSDIDFKSLIECVSREEKDNAHPIVPNQQPQRKMWRYLWNSMIRKDKKLEPNLTLNKATKAKSKYNKAKFQVIYNEKSIQTSREGLEQCIESTTEVCYVRSIQTGEKQPMKSAAKVGNFHKYGILARFAACLLCSPESTTVKKENKKKFKITIRRKEKKNARYQVCSCQYCRNKTPGTSQMHRNLTQTDTLPSIQRRQHKPNGTRTHRPTEYFTTRLSKNLPINDATVNTSGKMMILGAKLCTSQRASKRRSRHCNKVRQFEENDPQCSTSERSSEKIIIIKPPKSSPISAEECDSFQREIQSRTSQKINNDTVQYEDDDSHSIREQYSTELITLKPARPIRKCPFERVESTELLITNIQPSAIQQINETERYKTPGFMLDVDFSRISPKACVGNVRKNVQYADKKQGCMPVSLHQHHRCNYRNHARPYCHQYRGELNLPPLYTFMEKVGTGITNLRILGCKTYLYFSSYRQEAKVKQGNVLNER